MANLILTQTAGGIACGAVAGCTSGSNATQVLESRIGGSPSSVPVNIEIPSSGSLILGAFFQTLDNVPGAVLWDAGTWVARMNVVAGQMKITWEEVHICRFSSGCTSLATVGSATGLGIQCTGGVKTVNVTGAEQTAGITDEIYVIYVFSNGDAMSNLTIQVLPDQDLDTPIFEPMTALSDANFPDRNYYCGPFSA